MNDPNGLVYFEGEYHLFYQYHPHSAVWGPMHWGHAVSTDLVNWLHLPIALFPDEHGMIFSGSAVVDWNNTAGFGEKALIAVFTYNNHTYNDEHRVEDQNIAYSKDRGRTWTKYSGNPVVPHPGDLKDFRDPKVFWHQDHWVMLLAAGNDILFYQSSNLKQWERCGSFGGGYGSTDGVWETPDLFQLPVTNDSDSRWVLTVGVGNGHPAGGSGTQYFIGDFDGENFISENSKETTLWVDHGADYYAPQSWNDEPNGRRIMIGWMSNWQYANLTPTSTWRGSFSTPRELSLAQTRNGIRLVQNAIPELQSLRGTHTHRQDEIIHPNNDLTDTVRADAFEIEVEFQLTANVKHFGICLRVGAGEETIISYSVAEQTLTLDRIHSGQVNFAENFARAHSTPLAPVNDIIRLHVFVDSTSVEVFANGGLTVLTECIFPSSQNRGMKIFTDGGPIRMNRFDMYQLNPAKFLITEK